MVKRRKKRLTTIDEVRLLEKRIFYLSGDIRGLKTSVDTLAGLRGQIEAMADKVRVMEKLVRGALCQNEDT